MAQLKVKITGSGKPDDPRRVNLPTYHMIGDIDKDGFVTVEVPNDEVDEKGQLSKAQIRRKYRGQKLWDHDKVTDDLVTQ
jgi:hypothetical protein